MQQAHARFMRLQRDGKVLRKKHRVLLRDAQRHLWVVSPGGAQVIRAQGIPGGWLFAFARVADGAGHKI
ncbi:hypothetical protein D3C85_1641950 [compost metagenome]